MTRAGKRQPRSREDVVRRSSEEVRRLVLKCWRESDVPLLRAEGDAVAAEADVMALAARLAADLAVGDPDRAQEMRSTALASALQAERISARGFREWEGYGIPRTPAAPRRPEGGAPYKWGLRELRLEILCNPEEVVGGWDRWAEGVEALAEAVRGEGEADIDWGPGLSWRFEKLAYSCLYDWDSPYEKEREALEEVAGKGRRKDPGPPPRTLEEALARAERASRRLEAARRKLAPRAARDGLAILAEILESIEDLKARMQAARKAGGRSGDADNDVDFYDNQAFLESRRLRHACSHPTRDRWRAVRELASKAELAHAYVYEGGLLGSSWPRTLEDIRRLAGLEGPVRHDPRL